MESPSDKETYGAIIEGFLCPMCKIDFKTPEKLNLHFESFHIARSQGLGRDYDHLNYFKSVRDPRLERYATETNKLIIRLDKLLSDRPSDTAERRLHEQSLVEWLDGKAVKLCPDCTKAFNIARRQHHCRLCGSLMCQDCSFFFPLDDAVDLIGKPELKKRLANDDKTKDPETIRICGHCMHLLHNRKENQDTRNATHPIKRLFERIQEIKKHIEPEIPVYNKIINSLYEGDSIYTIGDASALRGKILREAEVIDEISKRIIAIPCAPGSREETLKKGIRLAMIKYIKEQLLIIPPIPMEEEIKKLQKQRTQELQQRIERERRLALEAFEKYELQDTVEASKSGAVGSAINSVDNWTAYQVDVKENVTLDPLVQQMQIIKDYIKQAREALRFEEVGILETNLRELQLEFYRQQQTKPSNS